MPSLFRRQLTDITVTFQSLKNMTYLMNAFEVHTESHITGFGQKVPVFQRNQSVIYYESMWHGGKSPSTLLFNRRFKVSFWAKLGQIAYFTES